jgi:hypothetical protein
MPDKEADELKQISELANAIDGNKPISDTVVLTDENISGYVASIKLSEDKLGTLTFFVVNELNQANPNVHITVSSNDKTVYNGLSNQYGLATTQILPAGVYNINFQSKNAIYNKYQISIQKTKYPVITIKPVLS